MGLSEAQRHITSAELIKLIAGKSIRLIECSPMGRPPKQGERRFLCRTTLGAKARAPLTPKIHQPPPTAALSSAAPACLLARLFLAPSTRCFAGSRAHSWPKVSWKASKTKRPPDRLRPNVDGSGRQRRPKKRRQSPVACPTCSSLQSLSRSSYDPVKASAARARRRVRAPRAGARAAG